MGAGAAWREVIHLRRELGRDENALGRAGWAMRYGQRGEWRSVLRTAAAETLREARRAASVFDTVRLKVAAGRYSPGRCKPELARDRPLCALAADRAVEAKDALHRSANATELLTQSAQALEVERVRPRDAGLVGLRAIGYTREHIARPTGDLRRNRSPGRPGAAQTREAR